MEEKESGRVQVDGRQLSPEPLPASEVLHASDGILTSDTGVLPPGQAGNIIANPHDVTYREIIGSFGEKGAEVVRFGSPSDFSNDKWEVKVWRGGALDQPQGVVARFLQLLKADSPRNWTYTTPLKAWYGLEDEGLAPDLVAPEMAAQGGAKVSLVPVVAASHRQTFLNALLSSPDQPAGSSENFLDWFATFRS